MCCLGEEGQEGTETSQGILKKRRMQEGLTLEKEQREDWMVGEDSHPLVKALSQA